MKKIVFYEVWQINMNITLTICGTFSVWNKKWNIKEYMARSLKPKVYPLWVNPQKKTSSWTALHFDTQPLSCQAKLAKKMNLLVKFCLSNHCSASFKPQNFKIGSVSSSFYSKPFTSHTEYLFNNHYNSYLRSISISQSKPWDNVVFE